MKTPVTIYVVHHPECQEAKDLASGLFHWFRLSYLSGDSSSCAAGLPVYFRRKINEQGLVPSINFDGASLNVVILLVDHKMVGQKDWLKAAVDLSDQVADLRENDSDECRAQLLPVALHDSFYRTGFSLSELQPDSTSGNVCGRAGSCSATLGHRSNHTCAAKRLCR